MDLRPDDELRATPGDFSSHVVNDALLVPRELARFARSHQLGSAEEFAGFAEAFPSTVGASLGWAPMSVAKAVRRLQLQLMEAGSPPPSSPRRRAYGFGT